MLPEDGFHRLAVSDWRQFGNVSIEFHPRLTILTGANASGKSTLLGILARHLSWMRQYSYAPERNRSGVGWGALGPRRTRRMLEAGGTWADIGSLAYSNGMETRINVPAAGSMVRQGYDLYLPTQQPVTGVFLNSHRSANGNYVPVPSIPTLFAAPDAMFEQYTNEVRTHWQGQWTGRSSQLALKEALMAAAVFGGGGSESVDFNAEAAAVWSGFQAVLAAVLPANLGFSKIRVRVPDVILETRTGDFVLDDASGGVAAIIEIAWQIFLRSRGHGSFTVLIDEPENHLHPSLQREILPSLLRAFPGVQFIVATHSPFVVTATPESAVFVLDYNDENRVESRQLDYANKAAGADETLKRVLGLPSTLPIWAEVRFDEIVSRHLNGSITPDQFAALRVELKNNGLEGDFPEAVSQVIDSHKTQQASE
jgi:predicted ATPase